MARWTKAFVLLVFYAVSTGPIAAQEVTEFEQCQQGCVRAAMLDRMWRMTNKLTLDLSNAFFSDHGISYNLQTFATHRAQQMMARGDFDLLYFYEGVDQPGMITTRNRFFDVQVAAVGNKGDIRLAGLPENADQFVIAMIKGDDFLKYIPTAKNVYQIDHVEQAFNMLSRGRVNLLTEFATYMDGTLQVPGFDPEQHEAVKLAGPLEIVVLFHDNEKGRQIRDLMDIWLYEKHQSGELIQYYAHPLSRASYPKEFTDPRKKPH